MRLMDAVGGFAVRVSCVRVGICFRLLYLFWHRLLQDLSEIKVRSVWTPA